MAYTVPVRIELTAATVQGRTKADRARIAKLPGVQKDIMRRTRKVARRARETCPVKTGKLKATIRAEKTTENGLPAGQVTLGNKGTPYANWVLDGTRPHVIEARRVKNLHFYWAKKGEWVTTPAVNHPGTARNPFLTQALRAARD